MEALSDLIGRERCWVELGQALTPAIPSLIPELAVSAREVLVRLLPSDRTLYARVLNPGQGLGKGVFLPIQKGDEVLVLFPGGDPNRAIVLGGLGNGKAPNPTGNLGLSMLLQHPAGVRLVTTDGQPEHGIVHGQLLDGLSGFLTAMSTFMASVTAATGAGAATAQIAAIAAAAAAFTADPATVEFIAAVSASAASGTAPGVGGPPYATTLHKVTP